MKTPNPVISRKICLLIYLPEGKKRSWRTFKDLLIGSNCWFDEKLCKHNTPWLETTCGQCKSNLKVYKESDFPKKNVRCKCKNGWLLKWEVNKTLQ